MRKSRKAVSTVLVAALLICVFVTMFILTACNKKGAIDMTNPMAFAELKPGSYEVSYDKDGNVDGYFLKAEKDMPARTVNYEIPTDPEALKELAYTLYQIGNKTMVTVPYASYFETGSNSSALILGDSVTDLPLVFNTVDIRNNLTGEHFRQTLQVTKENVEFEGGLGIILGPIMSSLSESAQRWYVNAPNNVCNFHKTTKVKSDGTTKEFDWSKDEGTKDFESKRYNISVNAIPYTASGYKGKINGQNATEANVNGMQWVYDEETGYSIPTYVDGGGRRIGYEKTDQHIFFSTGDDANKYDADGNLVEEDYYNTIVSATVEYNAEGGYYVVHMVMDSTKQYTHIDTNWALQDNKGAKDPNARFTKLEVTFELWDNGYFKQWEMWEDWDAPKAHGIKIGSTTARMTANQYYLTVFSYDEHDAGINKYYSVG
ncbi:MAG: hypothetical protein IJ978_00670 [Clostridia bacterium]|nr:hypothetical protein [Clostridia bacterium]